MKSNMRLMFLLPLLTGSPSAEVKPNPLIPYAIKGVICYQGKSNSKQAKEYETQFPVDALQLNLRTRTS